MSQVKSPHQHVLEISHLNASFAPRLGTSLAQSPTSLTDKPFGLHDIHLAIKPHSILALIGESGSGKSMLAQLLLRLQEHVQIHSGEVRFGTSNLLTLSQAQMRLLRGSKIAYIPQEPLSSLNPLHKIGKQIIEGYILHTRLSTGRAPSKAQQAERLSEILELVCLPKHLQNRYPFELSGGQRQRAMIAMSLINHPELVICDEPTTALDALIQRQILELLSRLKEKSAFLFISHDLGAVRGFCDEVAVMHQGRLIEHGSTQSLFKSPKQPYTRFLLEASILPKREDLKGDVKGDLRENLGVKSALDSENSESSVVDSKALARPALLELENFSVGVYKRHFLRSSFVPLARHISFTLKEGEILGIAGASGSGKSSLAMGLLGLLPTRGELRLYGENVSASRAGIKALREHIGLIFQDPFSSLSPRLRVGEIIAEGLEILGLDKERIAYEVESSLRLVGLDSELLTRYPFELSGGQKQRVMIARSLVRKPSILLLDEPTSALDKSAQKLVLELLLRLKDELGMSYILITHDLELLAHVSDTLLLLHDGRALEYGRSEDVLIKPQSAYGRELFGQIFGESLRLDSEKGGVG